MSVPLEVASVVLLAGIQGLSEALPISRSGHAAALRIWLEPGPSAATLEVALHLATATAFFVVARKRLVAALGEGLRAVARPSLVRESPGAHDAAALVIAAATSLATRALVRPFVELWADAPIAVGFGLVMTGLLVGSTALVSRGKTESPPLPLAAMLGAAHATGALPGGSDVGAALVLALWMGMKPRAALDFALILSGVTLSSSFVMALVSRSLLGDLGAAAAIFGLVTAFLGATLASGIFLRALLDRRALPLLAFWIFPIAFATIAHAELLGDGASPPVHREKPFRMAHSVAPFDLPTNPWMQKRILAPKQLTL